MKVGSLFSGVGGFDLGLETAGMEIAWQVEYDPQAQSVLRHHWPTADLHKDVNHVGQSNLSPVDLIAGGFPCQDVSVAGNREGLAGERSGLFYEFMRIVDEVAPRWVLIENVPGLLSSNGGRDMGAVLGTLGDLGYGWTYRVLDTQYFGPPQRRKRVFIVGCAGGFCPPEILLEPEGLPWNPAPRRETGARTAATLTRGANSAGKGGYAGRRQEDDYNIVSHALTAEGADASEDGTGRGTPIVLSSGQANAEITEGISPTLNNNNNDGAPIAFDTTQITSAQNRNNPKAGDPCHPIAAGAHPPAIAFNATQTPISGAISGQGAAVAFTKGNLLRNEGPRPSTECFPTLKGDGGDQAPHVVGPTPRRLTPRECERLQGWPDDWTRWGKTENGETIELKDSPRYRMCGNGVSAPVAEWIGRRIMESQ